MSRIDRVRRHPCVSLLLLMLSACAPGPDHPGAEGDDPALPDLDVDALADAKADGVGLRELSCGGVAEGHVGERPALVLIEAPPGRKVSLRLKVEGGEIGERPRVKMGLYGPSGPRPVAVGRTCGGSALCIDVAPPEPGTHLLGVVGAVGTPFVVTLQCGAPRHEEVLCEVDADCEGGACVGGACAGPDVLACDEPDCPHDEDGPEVPAEPGEPISDEACETCEWRGICVDVFVVATAGADGKHHAGHIFGARDRTEPERYHPLEVPSAQVRGPLPPLAGLRGGNLDLLRARLRQMFSAINAVFDDCCVFFEPGGAWLLDPARAGRLARRVTTNDEGPQLRGGDGLLDDFEAWAESDPTVKDRECLRMLIGAQYTAPDGEQGRAETPGDDLAVGFGAFDAAEHGFVPAHELGHALGLGHWTGAQPAGARVNVMSRRPRRYSRPVLDPAQCRKLRARADEVGEHRHPPVCEEDDEGEGDDEEEPGDGGDEGEGGDTEGEDAEDASGPDAVPQRCRVPLTVTCVNACAGGYCCDDPTPPAGEPPCAAVCDPESRWCRAR